MLLTRHDVNQTRPCTACWHQRNGLLPSSLKSFIIKEFDYTILLDGHNRFGTTVSLLISMEWKHIVVSLFQNFLWMWVGNKGESSFGLHPSTDTIKVASCTLMSIRKWNLSNHVQQQLTVQSIVLSLGSVYEIVPKGRPHQQVELTTECLSYQLDDSSFKKHEDRPFP